MICKVDFVPTVKEIMPQQSLANAWRWHAFAIYLVLAGRTKALTDPRICT
jgi:hypothetical protein